MIGLRPVVVIFGFSAALVSVASAGPVGWVCEFDGLSGVYVTVYDDQTPSRIGTDFGVGDIANVTKDARTGAIVFVELNTDAVPIGMLTISPDGSATFAHQTIMPTGSVEAPSQEVGFVFAKEILALRNK